MKAISLIIVCLLFSFRMVHGQFDQSSTDDFQKSMNDYYSAKHQNQKITGAAIAAPNTGIISRLSFDGTARRGFNTVRITSSMLNKSFLISSISNKMISRSNSYNELIKLSPEKFVYYNPKYKKQKKTAWILLGAGLACILTGAIIGASHGGDYVSGPASGSGAAGLGLIAIGTISSLVSIPFFISAGSNKRR